jgi:hypothetical protein
MPCDCPRGRRSVAECDECQFQDQQAERKRQRLETRKVKPLLPSRQPEQRRAATQPLLPCVHRGKHAGKMNCSCQGAREVFRCTKLIRPTSKIEPAFCTQYSASKYVGIHLKNGAFLDKSVVPLAEIVVCQPQRCDLYQPVTVPDDPAVHGKKLA